VDACMKEAASPTENVDGPTGRRHDCFVRPVGGYRDGRAETSPIVRIARAATSVMKCTRCPQNGDATLVKLSCLDDDGQGVPLSACLELELARRGIERATTYRFRGHVGRPRSRPWTHREQSR
jgi:hypothetical protein